MPDCRPRFLYFDVGNVLLQFDRHRVVRQIAEVARVPAERVWTILYQSEFFARYERGAATTRECYEFFCEQSGSRPDYARFLLAASDVFEINVAVVPIVAHLKAAGHRLGILSNTNDAHWSLIASGRYTLFQRYFERFALSYQLGMLKPEADMFLAAAELAGVPAAEIFFVDDQPDNVASARRVGLDAVPFTGAAQLARDLRVRGVRMNY